MYQLQGMPTKDVDGPDWVAGCIHVDAGFEKSMGLMGGFRCMKNGCASWLVKEVSNRRVSPVPGVCIEPRKASR